MQKPSWASAAVRHSELHASHVQGVAQDKGDSQPGAEVGDPVPDEHALHRDCQVLAVGFNDPHECLRRRLQVLVNQHLAGRIGQAHVHDACVQIDPAIVFVSLRVEAHLRPPPRNTLLSDGRMFLPYLQEGEAFMSIIKMEMRTYPALSPIS